MAHDYDTWLRGALIRLARENPGGIRKHLVPLIREAADRHTKTAAINADIQNVFNGFYTNSSGVKGTLAQAIRDLRKAVDLVGKALEDELDEAHSGTFSFNPPRYPADQAQMELLIRKHLKRNYSIEDGFAAGFARQVVRGQNY